MIRYVFALHNPSKADGTQDDPTLGKCAGFSARWTGAPLPLRSADRAAVHHPPYRYTLTRSWRMLSADVELVVINPLAYQATDPRDLALAHKNGVDVVGPENRAWHAAVLEQPCTLVVGWGNLAIGGPVAEQAIAALLDVAGYYGRAPMCLGRNKDGSPKHPLRLAYSTPLERWPA